MTRIRCRWCRWRVPSRGIRPYEHDEPKRLLGWDALTEHVEYEHPEARNVLDTIRRSRDAGFSEEYADEMRHVMAEESRRGLPDAGFHLIV